MMQRKPNKLRIIAGQWKGRSISIPCDVAQLRPTPDRVREDIFNWLAPDIHGAHCLDLFAGSGLLSFEAVSRGAATALLVEKEKNLVTHLKQCVQQLETDKITIQHNSALDFSFNDKQNFDVVFLDPPFHTDLLEKICHKLDKADCLADNAIIYIERNYNTDFEPPEAWRPWKQKTAGQVCYSLYQRQEAIND